MLCWNSTLCTTMVPLKMGVNPLMMLMQGAPVVICTRTSALMCRDYSPLAECMKPGHHSITELYYSFAWFTHACFISAYNQFLYHHSISFGQLRADQMLGTRCGADLQGHRFTEYSMHLSHAAPCILRQLWRAYQYSINASAMKIIACTRHSLCHVYDYSRASDQAEYIRGQHVTFFQM